MASGDLVMILGSSMLYLPEEDYRASACGDEVNVEGCKA